MSATAALTSVLTSGNGFKFNRTITKVHKRPQTKLYSKLVQEEEDAEEEEIQTNGTESILLDVLGVETSSSEEDLTPELSVPRNLKKSPYVLPNNFNEDSKYNVVEKALEKDDTLQNLSLKYGCKISELKRKNNIINDSEFYGLRTIKIPVKKFSYAEEKLLKELETKSVEAQLLPRSGSSPQDQNRSRFLSTSPRKLRIGDSLFGENRQEAVTFLQQMDSDLETMRQSMNSRKETLEEVTQVLTCKSIRPLATQHTTTNKNYFFKTSRIIMLLIIIVLVVFPVLLILWIKLGRSRPYTG